MTVQDIEPTPIWDSMVKQYQSIGPRFGNPESTTPPSMPPLARQRPTSGPVGNPPNQGANAPTRPAREPQAGVAGRPTQESP